MTTEEKCLSIVNYFRCSNSVPSPVRDCILAWNQFRVFLEGTQTLVQYLPKIEAEDLEHVDWKLTEFFVNLGFLRNTKADPEGAWVRIRASALEIVYLKEDSLSYQHIPFTEWTSLKGTDDFLFRTAIYLLCDGPQCTEKDYFGGCFVRPDHAIENMTTSSWMCKGFYRLQPCGKGRKETRVVFVSPHVRSHTEDYAVSHTVNITENEVKKTKALTKIEKSATVQKPTVKKDDRRKITATQLKKALKAGIIDEQGRFRKSKLNESQDIFDLNDLMAIKRKSGTGSIAPVVNNGRILYRTSCNGDYVGSADTPEEANRILDEWLATHTK